MRKIFSLGLIAISVAAMSIQLSAGEYAACEEYKSDYQQLGVYGICNAWHNAETDEQREHFADKFEEKALFEPPWLESGCPCWSADELNLICTSGLVLDGSSAYGLVNGTASFNSGSWIYNVAGTFFCSFTRPVSGQRNFSPLDQDEAEFCLAGIMEAVDGTLCETAEP
jgi:hypothetical protein